MTKNRRNDLIFGVVVSALCWTVWTFTGWGGMFGFAVALTLLTALLGICNIGMWYCDKRLEKYLSRA